MNKSSKEKIVIDTNIWYDFVGSKPNSKISRALKNQIEKDYEIYITTASIIEMLVKYKDDLCTIKKQLKPLIKGDIKIINTGFLPIVSSDIQYLYAEENPFNKINEIFELKKKTEAEFTRLYLLTSMIFFFHIISERFGYKFEDKLKQQKFVFYTKGLLEGNHDHYFNFFHKLLNDNYDSSVSQTIKNSFMEMICNNLEAWIYTYYSIQMSKPLKKIYTNKDVLLSSDKILRKIEKYKDNPFKIISDLNGSNKVNFNKCILELKNLSTDIKEISPQVQDYIIYKHKKYFEEKAKFEKNDITDMIILYSLSLDSIKFITLDRNLIDSLKLIDKSSYNLIQKFKLGKLQKKSSTIAALTKAIN